MRKAAEDAGRDQALTPDAFEDAMAPFQIAPGARVAVAVSGGADSMALTLLLSQWCEANDVSLFALTVDHNLRAAAANEVRQVSAWLSAKGVSHTVLKWEEGRALRAEASSPQNAAREARYALMLEWCAEHNCSHLFVAHHADDQIETFWMRLSRGSGIDGLAAMSASSRRGGVTIARPLLDFPKSDLIGLCEQERQPWVDDPSNSDENSTRVRFRNTQRLLEREGFTRPRLLSTVRHMRRAKEALDQQVAAFLDASFTLDAYGVGRLSMDALADASQEIGLRALSRILSRIGSSVYGPRFEKLETLYGRIVGGPWQGATLHGCVLARDGSDLVIMRERAHIEGAKAVSNAARVIWDGRFRLTVGARDLKFDVKGLVVEGLSPDDWRVITESKALQERPNLSPAIRETLPVIKDERGLLAAPHFEYVRKDINSELIVHLEHL